MPREIDAEYGFVMGFDRDGVLRDVAERYGLDGDALVAYAEEDTEIGYTGQHELIGSPWTHEAQVLYAFVRATRPALVYEFGTGYYTSTRHIAAALKANRKGRLVTLDVEPKDPKQIGDLAKRVEFVHKSAFEWEWPDNPDFIFEDASHTAALVEHITRTAKARLTPGGFCVHHDAVNYILGYTVREGLDAAGVDYVCYEVLPYANADVRKGLAFWRQDA